ncbi:hypothetical protein ACA910_021900 [Epithemia clementina (nom. ined.)]
MSSLSSSLSSSSSSSTKRHLFINDDESKSSRSNSINGSSSDDNNHESNHDSNNNVNQQSWIRGVNLGGWLVLERYITPYQFAVTTCHVAGDLCWYRGQINAPPNATRCSTTDDNHKKCKPLLEKRVNGQVDYPVDEYTLWQAFGNNTQAAEEWLNAHLQHFVTERDMQAVRASGATHVRIPLAHWILESQDDLRAQGDVWIVGQRWQTFRRLVEWARHFGLQVWPDIHTASTTQNGFDNSGRQMPYSSCQFWSGNVTHVNRSLQVIRDVTQRIMDEGMRDVVTGFGLLNEPFMDCDKPVYFQFLEQGLDIVRSTMGPDTHVYVSDMFLPGFFNNGTWWLDPARYHRTFLDTHYYQVFASTQRALSPRQHIALTCQGEYHVDNKPWEIPGGVASCCWHDPPHNTIPSRAVRRMIGEWSVAADILPADMLTAMMQTVARTGTVLHLNRQLSLERQDFLRNFAQAQMVIYEMQDQQGIGGAWFYWNVKMEGGAFAEWDFLRGIREGWIPRIPAPTVSSQSLHGSCYEIMARTADNASVIHPFPAPEDIMPGQWKGPDLDDDVVVSHGDSILHPDRYNATKMATTTSSTKFSNWMRRRTNELLAGGVGLVLLITLVCLAHGRRRHDRHKEGYTALPQAVMTAQ